MKQQIFQNDVTWNIVNSLLSRHIRYFSYFSQTSHMHPILVDISVTYIYIYVTEISTSIKIYLTD